MPGELLLDSYAAKRCPYALHLDRVADPSRRLGTSEGATERMRAGVEFELLVGEAIGSLGVDVVAIPTGRDRDADPAGWADDRELRLRSTTEAISSGAMVIWNPRLSPVAATHRSGEPDLLLRAPGNGRIAYYPVDVKAHFALARDLRSSAGSLLDLVAPYGPKILPVGPAASSHPEDLMQLAHYWRMLQALDLAPAGEPRGAIVGWSGSITSTPAVAWFELAPVFGAYEPAFAHALSVVERAVAVADGAELPAIGRPWYETSVCHECPWRGVCGPELLAAEHVSLVRPSRRIRHEIEILGVDTVDELASIDPGTLRPDGTAVGESGSWREAIARARLARAGDPVPFSFLPEVGGSSHPRPRVWRRPNVSTRWPLPRRDVELDVDMESVRSGVYLWGTLLSYPGSPPILGFAPGYRGFGEGFEVTGDLAAARAFAGFFAFTTALRAACRERGLTFGAYCYAGPAAEEPAMTRGAVTLRGLGGPDWRGQVAELLGSVDWIDLLDEMRSRVASLNGHGLKVVARATGFDWRAEDAGGEASMRWYERATTDADAEVRTAFRTKILEYNEDDVAATRHLREWFSTCPPESVPAIP